MSERDSTERFLTKIHRTDARTFVEKVVGFNRDILNVPQRPIGMLNPAEYDISVKCLEEEIKEFKDARERGDLIGMIDAMVDLKYFATGVMYKHGLAPDTIDAYEHLVHTANMTKKMGVNAKRGDGSAADAVKPVDFVSPEEQLTLLIDEQMSLFGEESEEDEP